MDEKKAFRAVLDEGTAVGQVSWAGTNRAILAGVQRLSNALLVVSSLVRETNERSNKIDALMVEMASVQASLGRIEQLLDSVKKEGDVEGTG